jgi:hypothetical protein
MDNELIKGSSGLFLVDTYSIFTSLIFLIYKIKWNFLSTCLDYWRDLGSFAYVMVPLLSQYRATRSIILGTNLVIDKLFNPNNFFVSSNMNVYSYSVVESIMLSCLELFQLREIPFRIKHIFNGICYLFNISLKKF